MGKVYAWKLVCGDDVAYCFLNENEPYFVRNCENIPVCSADYARTLQNEEAYKEAFNRMLQGIPSNFLKTIKDYSAYWEIGCDKPDGYVGCETGGDVPEIVCYNNGSFDEESVEIPADTVATTIKYQVSGYDSFTLESSNPDFTINNRTNISAVVGCDKNKTGADRSTTITLTVSKYGCPSVIKTMTLTQKGNSCNNRASFENGVTQKTISSSTPSFSIGFTAENGDWYFDKTGDIQSYSVDEENKIVTVVMGTNTGDSERSGTLYLYVESENCQLAEARLDVTQNAATCDIVAEFVNDSGQLITNYTANAKDTSFEVKINVSGHQYYQFIPEGSFINSATEETFGKVKISIDKNLTPNPRTGGKVTLKATKQGCPDVEAVLNISQNGLVCTEEKSWPEPSFAEVEYNQMQITSVPFKVSGDFTYRFEKEGIVSNVEENSDHTVNISFPQNDTPDAKTGKVKLIVEDINCPDAEFRITQYGIPCDDKFHWGNSGETVVSSAVSVDNVTFFVADNKPYHFGQSDESDFNMAFDDNSNGTVKISFPVNATTQPKTGIALLYLDGETICPPAEYIIVQEGYDCSATKVSWTEPNPQPLNWNESTYEANFTISDDVTVTTISEKPEWVQNAEKISNTSYRFTLSPNTNEDEPRSGQIKLSGRNSIDGCPAVESILTITQKKKEIINCELKLTQRIPVWYDLDEFEEKIYEYNWDETENTIYITVENCSQTVQFDKQILSGDWSVQDITTFHYQNTVSFHLPFNKSMQDREAVLIFFINNGECGSCSTRYRIRQKAMEEYVFTLPCGNGQIDCYEDMYEAAVESYVNGQVADFSIEVEHIYGNPSPTIVAANPDLNYDAYKDNNTVYLGYSIVRIPENSRTANTHMVYFYTGANLLQGNSIYIHIRIHQDGNPHDEDIPIRCAFEKTGASSIAVPYIYYMEQFGECDPNGSQQVYNNCQNCGKHYFAFAPCGTEVANQNTLSDIQKLIDTGACRELSQSEISALVQRGTQARVNLGGYTNPSTGEVVQVAPLANLYIHDHTKNTIRWFEYDWGMCLNEEPYNDLYPWRNKFNIGYWHIENKKPCDCAGREAFEFKSTAETMTSAISYTGGTLTVYVNSKHLGEATTGNTPDVDEGVSFDTNYGTDGISMALIRSTATSTDIGEYVNDRVRTIFPEQPKINREDGNYNGFAYTHKVTAEVAENTISGDMFYIRVLFYLKKSIANGPTKYCVSWISPQP